MSNLSFDLFGAKAREENKKTADFENLELFKDDVLVFDLETQNEFREVGGRDKHHLLKISVAGVYSYNEDKFMVFREDELSNLEKRMKQAKNTIGFNIKQFDFLVLQPYFQELDLNKIPYFDIMEDLVKVIGRRLPLNAIAEGTLGKQKSADGLQAIKFFREGNFDALSSYCLDDVRITRDIYEYGKKHKKISFKGKEAWEEIDIPVGWE